jgi:hypothetical protein
MSNPTSNFGWQMPTNTDLVSQLPADFEVFGQAVDTSLADLKGGTTGQVLKKNSNTDMDFVWAADAAGMTNPMTTTGDTIYSSSGSTPARLGIGSTGQVLTVSGGVPTWAAAAAGAAVSTKVNSSGSNKSTTSTTYVAIDTTNCRITATPTGTSAVIFLQAFINMSGSPTEGFWTISGGGTASPYQVYNNSYENQVRPNVSAIIPITGLTAGTSYNFDWMWRVNSGGTFGMVGDQSNNYPRMVFIG